MSYQKNKIIYDVMIVDMNHIIYGMNEKKKWRQKGTKLVQENAVCVDLTKYTTSKNFAAAAKKDILSTGQIRDKFCNFLNAVYGSIYPRLERKNEPVEEFRGDLLKQSQAFTEICNCIATTICGLLFENKALQTFENVKLFSDEPSHHTDENRTKRETVLFDDLFADTAIDNTVYFITDTGSNKMLLIPHITHSFLNQI